MAKRTEIEKYVRWMIASDILYRTIKNLGEKGMRRLNKTAKNIADLIEKKEEIGERIIAKIEELTEERRARTMKEGIEEFSKKYPQYGKILKGIIEEKRLERNKYLVYALKPSFTLAEEDYLQVIMDLGFDRREASAIYPHILEYAEREGKSSFYEERKILLKESKNKKKQNNKSE
ncbi:MAG: hypothetical protein QW117_00345 [Candidatus Pacearchaeota archaeon]